MALKGNDLKNIKGLSEAVRGSLIAVHAAAGLASTVSHPRAREGLRLLRAAKGLCRVAIAALSHSPDVSPAGAASVGPQQVASSVEGAPVVKQRMKGKKQDVSPVGAAPVLNKNASSPPGQGTSRSAKRRRRRKAAAAAAAVTPVAPVAESVVERAAAAATASVQCAVEQEAGLDAEMVEEVDDSWVDDLRAPATTAPTFLSPSPVASPVVNSQHQLNRQDQVAAGPDNQVLQRFLEMREAEALFRRHSNG